MMGLRLQEVLARAFTTVASDHIELARAAWPVLARPEIDPIFGLFFEANGLAAAGASRYKTLVDQLVEAWVVWLADFFEGTARQRRIEAETAIALIDGLLLLRQLSGPAAANRAAGRLRRPLTRRGPGRGGRALLGAHVRRCVTQLAGSGRLLCTSSILLRRSNSSLGRSSIQSSRAWRMMASRSPLMTLAGQLGLGGQVGRPRPGVSMPCRPCASTTTAHRAPRPARRPAMT